VTAAELIEQVQSRYEGELTEAEARSSVQAWLGVPAVDITKMAQFIVEEWGPLHLSTISGNDRGDHIDLIYHFVADGVSLNVRTAVDKGVDEIETITPIVPAAIMYEREITDMFGVTMAGHPDPRRLVLPEDWPEGDYPLRRDNIGAEEGVKDNGQT